MKIPYGTLILLAPKYLAFVVTFGTGGIEPPALGSKPNGLPLTYVPARIARIELTALVLETNILPLNYIPGVARIELTYMVLKTSALPLNYTPRDRWDLNPRPPG